MDNSTQQTASSTSSPTPPATSESQPSNNDSLGTVGSSQVSVGFAEPCPSTVANLVSSGQYVPPPSEKSTPVCDQCCVSVYCHEHDKFLLAPFQSKGLFLPSVVKLPTDAYSLLAKKLIGAMLRNQHKDAKVTSSIHQVDWYRVQQPKKPSYYRNRETYVACILPDSKNGIVCCCNLLKQSSTEPSLPNYEWLNLDEIKQRADTLLGPEAYTILAETKEFFLQERDNPKAEVEWNASFQEMNMADSVAMLANIDDKYPKERELLFSARYTEADIYKLFNEFVAQCFPSQYMSLASFRLFFAKLGWHEEESLIKTIFGAFVASSPESQQRPLPYLTFHELLLGLAAMEERADHRGNCLYLRLKFIFNFYDNNRDGKLNQKEVNCLVADINTKKGTSRFDASRSCDGVRQELSMQRLAENENQNRLVMDFFRQLANVQELSEDSAITFAQFANFDDAKSLDWLSETTEQIFRSGISAIDISSQKFAYKRPPERSLLASQVALIRYNQPCEKCRQVRFNMCAHGIRIDLTGHICGTLKFDLYPNYRDVEFRPEVTIDEAIFDWTMEFIRFVSVLSTPNPLPRPNKEGLKSLLKQVHSIMQKEPLVAKPYSPCFIIGEVRSNLEILYRLQTLIAQWMPFVNPINLVFLGNAFDPNEPLAADTAVYLFCLKVLAPNRVTLLRGPTEAIAKLPNSQMHREWIDQYGENTWQELCQILDLLPVAGVVDKRIFLTKSGLPLPFNKDIDQIEALNPSSNEQISVDLPTIYSIL